MRGMELVGPLRRFWQTTPTAEAPRLRMQELSEEDLIRQLKEAGFGIAVAGVHGRKEILFVSHAGEIFEP